MSERSTLAAPPAAQARAEVIARRRAQTNPAAARDYAEGEAHRANAETRPAPPPPSPERPPRAHGRAATLELSAKAIKLTLVVDPSAVAGFVVSGGDRVRFRVQAGARKLTGELNPKTVRKVIATIAEHGAEAVAVVLQGKLGDGDVVEEAGITVQVKNPKPEGH
jgi:hypothetical protein